MEDIDIVVADGYEMRKAQDFYDSQGYGGAPVAPSDFVVLAKYRDQIVGAGRLCLEQEHLWLRGMQVEPKFQRRGLGTKILQRLDHEIGGRMCCCLPHDHLVAFYMRAGFEPVVEALPTALSVRLASYLARGLKVVAMMREP